MVFQEWHSFDVEDDVRNAIPLRCLRTGLFVLVLVYLGLLWFSRNGILSTLRMVRGMPFL